ncbi:MAG TPA: 50S ribosomal protein L10 [Propioniciclava sp.]|jgi:large subunit ribosomal protein L10|uniref:50S ribosomal protein L10 n=1 Tax=Propioniciclava sp. TaxID=2038686 RepID=UPI002D0E1FEC|nr:50S ribosomal protein L10 [Propioniciclava sp.]HRL81649.1 50S ribosomal protein L10 [Propioniciclava sp.]
MARPDKAAAVEELKEAFTSSNAAVLTEYRGITVKGLQDLRRALGEDASYAVAKNTLTQIAAREAGLEGLEDQLTGPTAIAFIRGDVATVAKGLRDFAKDNPLLVIKAGVMDGRVLDADEVKKLADLESREVLLAKLAGAMQANLSKAVYLIAAPLNQAARALGALERAAAENPALLAGAVAAPEADQKPDTAEDASATDAAPAAEAN